MKKGELCVRKKKCKDVKRRDAYIDKPDNKGSLEKSSGRSHAFKNSQLRQWKLQKVESVCGSVKEWLGVFDS